MDEAWGHYAKGNKTENNKYHTVYRWSLKKIVFNDFTGTRLERWLQVLWGRGNRVIEARGYKQITNSLKISLIRYCIRAYWALKLIRRIATEYMHVLGTVSSALSCLLPQFTHITALWAYTAVVCRWGNSSTRKWTCSGLYIMQSPQAGQFPLFPILTTVMRCSAPLPRSHRHAMNGTESLSHLSWVWLLCRAQFIQIIHWSVCIGVAFTQGTMDLMVRCSCLTPLLCWQQESKASFKIQIFGRTSLKKMWLPKPIIHILNDSHNVWKKQHFEFKIISTH